MPELKTRHEVTVEPSPKVLGLMEKLATGQAVGFGLILGLLLSGLIYSMTRKQG